jgi:hypothetical protein
MSAHITPLSRRDERFYDQLAANQSSGRALWRVTHALPVLATGRIRDARNRIWRVPSTRSENKIYEVSLSARVCVMLDGRIRSECPDRKYNGKKTCVHIQAALEKERQYFGGDAREVFGAPDDEPPQKFRAV